VFYKWLTGKIHPDSYATRVARAEQRLRVAMEELELLMDCSDAELDELARDPRYAETAAELRANA